MASFPFAQLLRHHSPVKLKQHGEYHVFVVNFRRPDFTFGPPKFDETESNRCRVISDPVSSDTT